MDSSDDHEEEGLSELGKHHSEFGKAQPFSSRAKVFGSQTPKSRSPPTQRYHASTESTKETINNDGQKYRNRSKSGSHAADQKNAWAEGIALQ